MNDFKSAIDKRKADPYLDRRSGDDRRNTYDLEHFTEGGLERRNEKERRDKKERRKDCVKVSKWSSVCPKDETTENDQ
ncbi:MAG: hypothetical protein PVG51_13950 [Desulfosarcina sp.]